MPLQASLPQPEPLTCACPSPCLQVRGLLMDSEVESAQKERYLAGAHVVVGASLLPPCRRLLASHCAPCCYCCKHAPDCAPDPCLPHLQCAAGTPELIAAALSGPEAVEVTQHLFVVAVDEVDACFQVRRLEQQ